MDVKNPTTKTIFKHIGGIGLLLLILSFTIIFIRIGFLSMLPPEWAPIKKVYAYERKSTFPCGDAFACPVRGIIVSGGGRITEDATFIHIVVDIDKHTISRLNYTYHKMPDGTFSKIEAEGTTQTYTLEQMWPLMRAANVLWDPPADYRKFVKRDFCRISLFDHDRTTQSSCADDLQRKLVQAIERLESSH